jgi:hypothetical protein
VPKGNALANDGNMQKRTDNNDEMLDEYDFSDGVRGQYVEQASKSPHVIVLEPDVAEVFTTSKSVNETLRGLLPIIRSQTDRSTQQ